jgi:hypothetical protein
MSIGHIYHLLTKKELSTYEIAEVISEYLYDNKSVTYRLSVSKILMTYNTYKKLMVQFIHAKSYYINCGYYFTNDTLEFLNEEDLEEQELYYDHLGMVYIYLEGLLHPLAYGIKKFGDFKPKKLKDFH